MTGIQVVSRTQRIVVHSDRSISIVNAGPVGPRGFSGPQGPSSEAASGTIAVANLTWLIPHNLDLPEELFNPSSWWFEDETGVPMEPVEVHWSTSNIAIAEWLDPVRGRWVVN